MQRMPWTNSANPFAGFLFDNTEHGRFGKRPKTNPLREGAPCIRLLLMPPQVSHRVLAGEEVANMEPVIRFGGSQNKALGF
jgi:hypothetical protein